MPVLCGAEQSVRTGVAKELNSSTSQSELYPEDRLSWSDRSRQRCGVLRKGRKRERGVTQLKSPAVKACFMKPGPLSNRATGIPRFTEEARKANQAVVDLLHQIARRKNSSTNCIGLAACAKTVDRSNSRND